ncbi:hypothetical protein [Actinomadura livida]|uniref:Uncharacterized protein n=1 Tax=Actinomadura livida TaxID=79909 RepID=A0A7W7IJK5_9ACTN|nr:MULTISPECIES: hypothetical protein [Actinomadura]MBB4778244.1 hypothetical protein [Actinomadura catellatispora]GGU40043.1 hypothetical protein GCM10010208_75200 [Actinomadura livida]
MGEMLNVERGVLLCRTRMGRKTAVRHLDVLSVALRPRGWRFVKLYRPAPIPLLRVYANGAEEIGIMVSVLAIPGGAWGYHEAQRGRRGYLAPCGDAKAAAEVVDELLTHRMYPSTW